MIHMSRWLLNGVMLLFATAMASAEEPARATLRTCSLTHNVADLIVPLDNYTLPVVKLWKQRHPDKRHVDITAEEALIDLVTHTIASDTWCDAGGKGTIQFYPLGLCLIVSQTPDVQDQIVELLRALRKMDRELSIESQLIEMEEDGQPLVMALPKITFLDEQNVRVECEPLTSNTSVSVAIRTQANGDGTFRIRLRFAKTKTDMNVHILFIEEVETNRTVKCGQAVRVPLYGESPGAVRRWLFFTLREVPQVVECIPRIPR